MNSTGGRCQSVEHAEGRLSQRLSEISNLHTLREWTHAQWV